MTQVRLFTPGPTHIPERVLKALSLSELHHRTAEFRALFEESRERLKAALNSPSLPLFLSTSGTGGMEAALANCLGDSGVLGYLDAGKFGERWGDIAKAKGLSSISLQLDWGKAVSPIEVRGFLQSHPEVTHFAFQHCETSTTVAHPIKEVTTLLKTEFPHIIVLIDAISSATTTPLDLCELHWDCLVLASQKAFMLPPGLSMLFCSERYWHSAEGANPRSLYLNLKEERKTQDKGDAAWTPTTTLIAGLRESLSLFEEEGWENVYSRHSACRDMCYSWFDKLGMRPVNRDFGSTSVTGGFPPASINIPALLKDLQNRYGYRVADGQDLWKGKILRFGHMGVVHPEDLDRCFRQIAELIS